MELIELQDICKTYEMGDVRVPVLKDVSLKVAHGELVALMGASGSGKSTLMNILGCLDRPTSGRYWLDGDDVSDLSASDRAVLRNRRIGFVFQNFNLLARTSAWENVVLPLSYAEANLSEREMRERATEMLRRVGLEGRMDHEPSQLSGGQQQRVAIARAIAAEPALVLADEPTANVDSATGEALLDLMARLNQERGVTFLFSTHDRAVMRRARRLIRLKDGAVAYDGPAEAVDEADGVR